MKTTGKSRSIAIQKVNEKVWANYDPRYILTRDNHPWPKRSLKPRERSSTLKPTGDRIFVSERLVTRRFKGERGRATYLEREYLLDPKINKRGIERELVRAPTRIGKLKRELPRPDLQVFSDRDGSSMNKTLAAMASAIYYGKDDCPPGMDADDWAFNLKRARQLLEKNGVDRWGMWEIAEAILPPRLKIREQIRRIYCDWCRFPILFGYRVNGRLVERKRKLPVHFCEKACLMNHRRRHPRDHSS